MRTRLGVAVVATVISLAVVASTARACDQLGGSVSPQSPTPTGPGDPITYSISGMLQGAEYRVTFNGQTVASGVSSGGAVSGSFSMPDLGAQPQTVYVTLYSDHSDDPYPWDRSFPVRYAPPAPASSPAPEPAGSATAPAVVRAHTKHHAQHHAQRPITVANHVAKRQRHQAASSGVLAGAAPSRPVAGDLRPRHPGSGSESAQPARRQSSDVPQRVLDALGSSSRVGPADVPNLGLLMMALIFIAGTALAGFIIYLSQIGPDPRAAIKAPAPLGRDALEVELQEMIADEMARRLLSDLDLTKPPVG